MLVRVLVALRPWNAEQRIARLLQGDDALVLTAGGIDALWQRLAVETFDLVVVDRKGLGAPIQEAIATIRQLPDEPDVVILTDQEDAKGRAALLAAGCVAVVNRRLSDTVVRDALRALIARRRKAGIQNTRFRDVPTEHRLGDFMSDSPAMQRLIYVARRVTQSDTSLLILGETGVGKEWLARAIHEEGARAAGPFTTVNCAAIVETLLESELFGHEEGAFTGAHRAHRGCFELAHGGTIFLDEIAEMPNHLQVKLLRVLQERKIQRVGSEREIDVDVRMMAATNRDLETEIRERRFRSDLYYRIGVVTMTVPPLRERREDIPGLIENYFQIYQSRLGRHLEGIDEAAREALVRYDWPGNVRELINVMERAVLLCDADRIGIDGLPAAIAGRVPGAIPQLDAQSVRGERSGSHWRGKGLRASRQEVVWAFEREYLSALLRETSGRIAATAQRAGISARALSSKMRRYGLRKEEYRDPK